MTLTQDEVVAQALATAIKDSDRISDLLDELSRGRLWLPLPDDGGPVTDGSAVKLPTVVYLGSDFVPAFTSAELLAGYGAVAGSARAADGPQAGRGPRLPSSSGTAGGAAFAAGACGWQRMRRSLRSRALRYANSPRPCR